MIRQFFFAEISDLRHTFSTNQQYVVISQDLISLPLRRFTFDQYGMKFPLLSIFVVLPGSLCPWIQDSGISINGFVHPLFPFIIQRPECLIHHIV